MNTILFPPSQSYNLFAVALEVTGAWLVAIATAVTKSRLSRKQVEPAWSQHPDLFDRIAARLRGFMEYLRSLLQRSGEWVGKLSTKLSNTSAAIHKQLEADVFSFDELIEDLNDIWI